MASWRFLWSEIRQRPGRALLTVLSVVIGVATVLAVSLTIATTRRAFQEMYQTLAGKAALQFRADAGSSFDIELLRTFDHAPGVKTAVPVLQRRSLLYGPAQRTGVMVLGILPEQDALVRDYVFEEGSFPVGSEVLLEVGLARSLGVKCGDSVSLLTRRGPRAFRVCGLLAPRGAAAFQGGAIVFMPLDRAQRWFRATNKIDAIDLVLEEGASEDHVAAQLAERLPPGFSVVRPATRTELAREILFTSEQGLNMAAALSLVAAGYIIINSLFMNLTERRRRLATLRTIGATRAQIFGFVLLEGTLIGLAGTLLGIFVGIVGAAWLIGIMESVFQTALPVFEVSLGPVLKVAVLGPGVSLAAVLLPAWKATRISPLEGMRPAIVDSADRPSRWGTWVAVGLLAAASAGGVALYRGILSPHATPPVVVASLVGTSLLLPLLLQIVVGILAKVFESFSRLNAFLACRQILRQHTRSSLTAGVLFVAVVMSVGMGNSVLSNSQDVKDWSQRAIVGDYVIRGTMLFDLTTGESPALPDDLIEKVQAVPGVLSVEPWTFASTTAEKLPVLVVARSYPEGAPLSLDLYRGEPDEVRRRLHEGEAVISTIVAQRLGKQVGDTITLSTAHGPQTLRVAATCDDYIMGGTVVHVQSAIADQRLGLTGIHALMICVEPERREECSAALYELCRQDGLLIHSTAELAAAINQLTAGINAALWALLLVGFVVAAFGLVNTLTMNVMEQTRELGLMRMVGMTRGQVRMYVVSQAAVIAIVALVPGAAMGESVAYITNLVTNPLLGHPVDFQARPEVIVWCLAFGLSLSLIAALLPAARAARLLIGEAIQYE